MHEETFLTYAGTDAGNEEHVTISAMCSDSNAAVRWSVLPEDKNFEFIILRYTCTDVNGSEIHKQVWSYHLVDGQSVLMTKHHITNLHVANYTCINAIYRIQTHASIRIQTF